MNASNILAVNVKLNAMVNNGATITAGTDLRTAYKGNKAGVIATVSKGAIEYTGRGKNWDAACADIESKLIG